MPTALLVVAAWTIAGAALGLFIGLVIQIAEKKERDA